MKHALKIIGLCLLLINGALFAAWRPGEMRIKIDHVTLASVQKIVELGIEIDDIQFPVVYLYVIEKELEALKKAGFKPEIIIPDMVSYSAQLQTSPGLVGYHDYHATLSLVDSLIHAFPDIIRKVNYGESVQGKPLFAVKISDNVMVNEPEPEVGFDGCYHGDEIISAEILIRLMRELCLEYGQNKQVTRLVNEREIWFLPIVNPDGRQALTRRNSNEIDLNRDWGFMWDAWGNSAEPYSQPETRAMLEWLLDHQFVICQSFHAGKEMISFPWSYRPSRAPDHAIIKALAAGYATASHYGNLAYGNGYQQLYPINGNAKDSYYGIRGALGWTMEVAKKKSPPFAEINHYYQQNRPAIFYLLETSGNGLRGIVRDVTTGKPVSAILWVSNRESEFWPVYTSATVGDFYKLLPPGNYSLKITANGYETKFLPNIEILKNEPLSLTIHLKPRRSSFAYQVIACRVPGNNYSDEGLTYRTLTAPDRRRYSLGRNGWIVLDMGETIFDFPGNDVRIYEGDLSPEGFTVKIANHWSGPWQLIGSGKGTTAFDISASGLNKFRYVRIDDDGDGFSGGANAGFDLDAIEGNLLPETGPFLMATACTIVDTLSNFNGVWETGETADLALKINNFGDDPAGRINIRISCENPIVKILQDSSHISGIDAGKQASAAHFRVKASSGITATQDILLDVEIRSDQKVWRHSFPVTVHGGARIFCEKKVQFEQQFVGFHTEKKVEIFNHGSDTLKIFQFQNNAHVFSITEQQMIIPPGAGDAFTISFEPQKATNFTDTLTLLCNDPVQSHCEILLTGEGAFAPELHVANDSMAIELSPTDSTTVFLLIDNPGAGNLTYSAQVHSTMDLKQAPVLLDNAGYFWSPVHRDHAGKIVSTTGASNVTEVAFPINEFVSESIAMPFSFPNFGNENSSIQIHRNGAVYLGDAKNVALKKSETDFSASNLFAIMPLFGKFAKRPESRVFYAESPGEITVQWQNLFDLDGRGPFTFAAQLRSDGRMIFQYTALGALEQDFLIGTSFHKLTDEAVDLSVPMRIELHKFADITLSNAHGNIASKDQQMLPLHVVSKALPVGNYALNLKIESNDPDKQLTIIPIILNIKSDDPARDDELISGKIQLLQNFPNPFNPSTQITFQLPEKAHTTLTVYNMLGQVVETLLDENLSPGEYHVTWNGVNQAGQELPSGIYFYELRANNFSQIKKMVLLH